MRNRLFVVTVFIVGTLAVLMLVTNVREQGAALYGPPTVDEELVRSKVEAGQLSFRKARFFSPEGGALSSDDGAASSIKDEISVARERPHRSRAGCRSVYRSATVHARRPRYGNSPPAICSRRVIHLTWQSKATASTRFNARTVPRLIRGTVRLSYRLTDGW